MKGMTLSHSDYDIFPEVSLSKKKPTKQQPNNNNNNL
jgi:hypothetical protein